MKYFRHKSGKPLFEKLIFQAIQLTHLYKYIVAYFCNADPANKYHWVFLHLSMSSTSVGIWMGKYVICYIQHQNEWCLAMSVAIY